MHYLLQATAFLELWAAIDRGEDSWTQNYKDEFQRALLNALMGNKLQAMTRQGFEIAPETNTPLEELYVTLSNCIDWMNRSSAKGIPSDEFELAYMLGLDVIISKLNKQEPADTDRVLPPVQDALINGSAFEFIVAHPLPPVSDKFKSIRTVLQASHNSSEKVALLSSRQYFDLLELIPAVVIQMRVVDIKNQNSEFETDMCATPAELIHAFGEWTGMNSNWFDDISKQGQGLRDARLHKGGAGRKPLFCPYKVMMYLLNTRRRNGPIPPAQTAWRALRRHFPSVYAVYETFAPESIKK